MSVPVLVPATAAAPVAWRPDAAQETVLAHAGPGVLVALGAPGTGKSSTLVRAVGRRLREGVPAAHLRVLAFSRARARDLRAALAEQAPQGVLPVVTTFHGLAFDILGRSLSGDPDARPPRLLSGAEEDVRIRDLLRGAVTDGIVAWPDDLAAALPTLGLANDVRAFLARAREHGIDPERLAAAGRVMHRPVWVALAQFLSHESEVMALEDLVDYTALVESAIGLIDDDPALVGHLTHVFVDDFHEADPLQRQLLAEMCRHGAVASVMADPDVTAYAFRGADRLGAMRLADEVGARLIALNTVYRGGGEVRQAFERVRRQPPLPGLSAGLLHDYRHPVEVADQRTAVRVTRHDSLGDLAAHVARDLRRRHLGLAGDATPWSDMAVLVPHSGDVEVLRRALETHGVPVRIATDALPLPEEPAVATLLSALRAALDPAALQVSAAMGLILGPLCGLDPVDLRSLARALRTQAREASGSRVAPAGTALVRDFLVDVTLGHPPLIDPRQSSAATAVAALGALLGVAHQAIDDGAQPADVLWLLWAAQPASGVSWPERLREAALAGHRPSGHDLDAVLALFDAAERLSERYAGALGVEGLLAGLSGQRLPGESIASRADATPAVELLTARLAVGRSWPHVVIVGAQEGLWPRLSVASSSVYVDALDLLTDELLADDLIAPAQGAMNQLSRDALAAHLADERRLFCLALSRASQHCHVAVIERDGEHGERPSRFVDDLDLPIESQPGRPPRAVTLEGLVADLRTVAEDPDSPVELREVAADRLAALARAVDDAGDPLVPLADPGRWWGIAEPTPGVRPVRPSDRPVALSGSGLSALGECPLRWFLSRAARVEGPPSTAIAFGNIVHVLAERVGGGELPADPDVLLDAADRIWPELGFDPPWQSEAEHAILREALERLCHYHRTCGRQVVATEQVFDLTVPVAGLDDPDGGNSVRLRGSIDRIEIDDDGQAHLIDFKTGRSAPSDKAVRTDPQLGVYQVAAQAGALASLDDVDGVAGAALVQLRKEAGRATPLQPRVQPQPALVADEEWLTEPIRVAVERIRAEEFPAVVNPACGHCAYASACPAQQRGTQIGEGVDS